MKLASFIFLILGAGFAVTLFCVRHEWDRLGPDPRADRIVVEKAARRLTLFRGATPLESYRVALGQ